jgi:signal transduction histidine kinase
LVQAHRGRIWAEGRPNEGATFFVELPLAGAVS